MILRRLWMACVLLAVAAGAVVAAEAGRGTLTGDTSRPEMSTFALGEPVVLNFQAAGLAGVDPGLKLLVEVVDEHDRVVARRELPAQPDASGAWRASFDAPHDRLGFYRVRARLSNGVTLAKLGSRQEGYLTYCVVPDPARRPLLPPRETFFGMQGGFSAKVNILPYLGVRWVLGGYAWRDLEPSRSGELAEKRAAAAKGGKPFPAPAGDPGWSVGGKPWKLYSIPTLFFAPKWAVLPDTLQYCTGTLTPEGEKAWRAYCLEVGKAYAAANPDLPEHLFQITWEPVYPWGFKGSDQDLIRIYQIAYQALHEADPRARVIGPTGAGINRGDLEWNANLLRKGLGRFLDGFSIHPYHPLPPERNGLIENTRALRETVRQYAGRDLPRFGTEQGRATEEDPSKELEQARGLIRAHLIMMGEGYRVNFAFYIADYPSEPGYGYFYNLNPQIPWGTDKIAPKPIAPAYAALSFLLEGHRSAGPIEWLGETAMGYAYERAGSVLLAVWDYGDRPREVSLPVGVKQVERFDWMGNREVLPAPNGVLKLTLGPEPIYLRGVSAELWGRQAAKPLRLKESRLTTYPGATAVIEGSVSAPAGRPLRGVVSVEADARLGAGRSERVEAVAAGRTLPFRFPVAIPAKAQPGSYPVKLVLRGPNGALAAGGLMLRVAPPLAVARVAPLFFAGRERGLAVELKDAQGSGQRGSVTVALRGVPETRKAVPFVVPPGGSRRLVVRYPDPDVNPLAVYQAAVAVTTAKGYRFEQAAPVNFLQAARLSPSLDGKLADWAGVPAIPLRGREAVVRSPQFYRGGDDLAAQVRFAWDSRAFYLAFEVTDDTFYQPSTGFNTWKGDCLQVGFDLDAGKAAAASGNLLADAGSRHRTTELDLALTPNGPEVFRTLTFDKDRLAVRLLKPEEAQLAVSRAGRVVTYEAAIPWTALGAAAAPRAGAGIGLAATVNDMDSATQTDPKALGIFGGITPTKDPAKFGVVVLGGAP